ncbi:hypothetical protein N7U66_02150 [Lacinutrix neustonica]|uniref:Uncharacterized protein n=1 Tax=Lacinutrix neustonica TaxID=2980107 RepID=A0A9E8MVV5_9FLAO|nr:hypothetical protein [Lacinutrix neustonica]WAC02533.1 hypothetical protein N7U66_02150 [Lacinutrix neustonica]
MMYRDHSAADGDLVRVYVNDDVMVSRELLESHTKGFFLTLIEGDNVVDIEALNEGSSGPNTAEIIVLDDKGDVLLRSQWNLNTGVKATFTVRLIKDE